MYQAERYTLSMEPFGRQVSLISMSQSMAEIQQTTQSTFLFILSDNIGFKGSTSTDDIQQECFIGICFKANESVYRPST